jgi:hypothetical protein
MPDLKKIWRGKLLFGGQDAIPVFPSFWGPHTMLADCFAVKRFMVIIQQTNVPLLFTFFSKDKIALEQILFLQ